MSEYINYIERIWSKKWLTNRGELVVGLESKLKNFLNVESILITNNGTFPIQVALKLLGQGGEIITTPFSYVATTSAIVWENCTPIFVDIHPEYLTIDEKKIEEAITSKTTCILATHVFGNPCNISEIERIASKYNLSIIYDAAHAFGVQYQGKSIFEYGDISTCSFHATKLFHTGEGGAFFIKDKELFKKAFYSHNFGHDGYLNFYGLGVNGKISELQAALGLANFPYIQEILDRRKYLIQYYRSKLDFSKVRTVKIRENTDWNYSYMPIIFESEAKLLTIQTKLNNENIFPRRYFYPSLNTLNYLNRKEMPVSENISSRILCLPLYHTLKEDSIDIITKIIITNT